MKFIYKIENQLFNLFSKYFNSLIFLFMVFVISESVNIYKLKIKNDILQNDISEHINQTDESIEEILVRTKHASMVKMSLQHTLNKIEPFRKLLYSYEVGSGTLMSFIIALRKSMSNLDIMSFDQSLFETLEDHINLSSKYPQLERYVVTKAKLEFALRSQSLVGGGSCCMFLHRTFTIAESVGDKYHFHPNNLSLRSCNSSMKINGETVRGEYLWKPTRRGMHYFDIEYLDFENYRLQSKKFRIGLKVT